MTIFTRDDARCAYLVALSREGEPFFEADFGGASVVSSFDEVEVVAP